MLSDVNVLNVSTSSETQGSFILHYNRGSEEEMSRDFSDFQPQQKTFTLGQSLTLNSSNGRSSSEIMPYFSLEKPGSGGDIFAIGWSGQWQATFKQASSSMVVVSAKQQIFAAQLLPGEEVRSPSMLHMSWSSTYRHAQNNFRNAMYSYYTPSYKGAKPTSLSFASAGGLASFEQLTAPVSLAALDNIKLSNMKYDAFWIDAGWYKVLNGSWLYGLGDWIHDSARFPSGLRPISDRARAAGMDFVLWFEPERLSKGSNNLELFRRSQPNRILSIPNSPAVDGHNPDVFTALNLADDDTRDWLTNLVANQLSNYSVGIYRQDMNVNLIMDFWRKKDSEISDGANVQMDGALGDNVNVGNDSSKATLLMDFDGDGKKDLILIVPGPNQKALFDVLLSNGSSFGRIPGIQLMDIGDLNSGGEPVIIVPADVNGDGKSDIVRLVKNGTGKTIVDVLFSNGRSLYRPTGASGLDIGDWAIGGELVDTVAMDVNGDKLTDLVRIYKSGTGKAMADILFSNGTSFGRIAASVPLDVGMFASGDQRNTNLAADVNGDGMIDLLRLVKDNDNTIADVLLSNGVGFYRDGTNAINIGPWVSNGANTEVRILDFNRDGRDDLLRIARTPNDDRLLDFLASNGSSFGRYNGQSGELLSKVAPVGSLVILQTGDVNGDKKGDIIVASKSNGMLFYKALSVSVKNFSLKRDGITEAKYISNLYAYWDSLRSKFPSLLIDNCASGGRRLDFEAMRRSVPLWRSDKSPWNPLEMQNQTFGLSDWLPFHGSGADMSAGVAGLPYAFKSGMGAVSISAWPFAEPLTSAFWAVGKSELAKWQSVRDLFVGDYYPLISYNAESDTNYFRRNDIWMAWQYDRPDLGRGLAQVFRRAENKQTTQSIRFQGLKATGNYKIFEQDSPAKVSILSGQVLMNNGFSVTLDTSNKAAVIVYELQKELGKGFE
jgi:hypothetical protein